MAGYRFWLLGSFAAGMIFTHCNSAWAQNDRPNIWTLTPTTKAVEKAGLICKVYSLAELGDDLKLCKWIAETVPEVIQSASWKQDGVKITYYAPGKVLVINHSAAVHTQVDAFLQDMKKSMPQAKMASNGVMQAQFAGPDNRSAVQVPPSQAYPVPYPPATPKHLFHFIIRYEGEGVIDSNVVKFTKAMSQEAAKGAQSTPPVTAYQPVPVPGVGVGVPLSSPPTYVPSTSAGGEPASRPTMPPADSPPARGNTLPSLSPGTFPSAPPLVPVPF